MMANLLKLLLFGAFFVIVAGPVINVDEYDDDEYNEPENDDDDEEPEEEEPVQHPRSTPTVKRTAVIIQPIRTTLKCYVCSFKRDQKLNACLDPVKYKVKARSCHSADDQCFTSVQGESEEALEMVVRGCRTACVNSDEWHCCDKKLCNNIPYAKPVPVEALALAAELTRMRPSKAASPGEPPTVLCFVTVLLLVQTIIRVTLLGVL